MASATFTARGHVYQQDDIVIPSVTQVLTLAGIDDVSRVPLFYLERAAAIGTAVHEACEFMDQDDLDIDSVHPLIVGHVLAYQKFKQETGFEPLIVEQRGIGESNGLRFGFCLDRIGMLNGEKILLDIKTSSKAEHAWQIQTAGYADAIDHTEPRLVIHTKKDGNYKVIRHDDLGDFETWLAALNVAHWKLAHGAKLPH